MAGGVRIPTLWLLWRLRKEIVGEASRGGRLLKVLKSGSRLLVGTCLGEEIGRHMGRW